MSNVTLVGILNVTPDSFSDGGQFLDPAAALRQARMLFDTGAGIVDIGAESTNPKKHEAPLSAAEELARLLPVLHGLLPAFSGRISIDSYHPETIETLAQQFGNSFIANDVTGMNNPALREVVVKYNLRCFVSHLPARFGTDIQAAHHNGKLDDAMTVRDELLGRRQQLIDAGLAPEKIVLDPGIGFGKTMRLNWRLLEFARLVPGIPVMVGYSRKRFLATDPNSGTLISESNRYDAAINLAAGKTAVAAGASYLRVHDVAAHTPLLSS